MLGGCRGGRRVERSSDDVKRYGERDYENDYTRCRLRTGRPQRPIRPERVRSVIYRASCHRVARRQALEACAARYLVAATVWNLRLHSFGVSP